MIGVGIQYRGREERGEGHYLRDIEEEGEDSKEREEEATASTSSGRSLS